MSLIRFVICLAALSFTTGVTHAKLIWSADFESYNVSGGAVDVALDSSGGYDTFSSTNANTGTGFVYTTQVTTSTTLTGNALKLCFTNNSGANVSATAMQISQYSQAPIWGSGVCGDALVLSYDVVRSGSNGISGSRSYAYNSAANTSGGNNTTTTGVSTTRLRYTYVVNQTGATITLPGTLGSLAHNAAAGYYFSGTTYSGLVVTTGVSSTDIAGFGTGSYRSNSLATGASVTLWCDNMGLWNKLSDTVNGTSVLSLPPGTVVPQAESAVPPGFVWGADFESYDTSSGAVDVAIDATGDYDTFSSKSSSTGTGLTFTTQVTNSSVLSGNALKLTFANNSGANVSATFTRIGQYNLPCLGTSGALVLSYDVVRTGSNGISGSRSYPATDTGATSGNNNTTTTGAGTTPLRYTLVLNQTGVPITLPGTMGTLSSNCTAGYYYDGASYTGLAVATGASSSSLSGFVTGTYRSNSLASGSSVTVWCDNMSLWNSLSATANGVSVLSLPPGTSALEVSTVWHVDAVTGNDTRDGRSAATAFASIQHAVNLAQPGDTVLVHPGIYYENILVKQGGTAAKPIRILADQVAQNRVIISGAVRSIREKTTAWVLVDAALGLYRVPLSYRPTRVLADRVDLLPYPNLEDLRAFRYLEDDYPGHKHGFAWDSATQSLYVRLRADGKYGVTNPNSATMAVSGPTGTGSLGQTPSRPEDFLFKFQMTGPAHAIVDGFTFETPGIAAVYTAGSDLVVRNCWFYGCRSGVSAADSSVNRVTVEQCYVTHYPAYSDILDTIQEEAAAQLAKSADYQKLMHWQRKGGNLPVSGGVGIAYGYESGFTRCMGADWVVRNNHFFEVFEGFSSGSVTYSQGARIYGNRFERLCDNAVETESHAQNIQIYNNLLIDVFEPFSWQPQGGIALPGPVYIYDNTVTQTAETNTAWVTAHYDPGLFKIGIASDEMWDAGLMGTLSRTIAEAPGGFWVAHNTLLVSRGRMLTALNPTTRSYKGFTFLNNIAGTRLTSSRTETGIVFDYNFIASYTNPPTSSEQTLYSTMIGAHGQFYALPQDLNLTTLTNGGLVPGSNCPANGRGLTSRTLPLPDGTTLTISATVPLRIDPGALPFQSTVGPQPR